MRKAIVSAVVVLFLLMGFSNAGVADVNIGIGINLPPVIAFAGPPNVVVIPGTYVYVAPDVPEDLFFFQGYWWRPWRGSWYRSRHYNEGWGLYRNPPYELRRIPSHWRDEYRDHHWRGREWNYDRISHPDLQRNWWRWEQNQRWDKSRYRQTRYPEGRNFRWREERREDRRDDRMGERREERRDQRENQREDRRDDRGRGRR